LVDLGYRGREVDDVAIVHRGKAKTLTKAQRRWLRRRQAVEPVIGHLKADHRMDRCRLKGALGDALHAIACAAGYNLRWLMRWITSFCALMMTLLAALLVGERQSQVLGAR
jgi:IS5 family transposase